MFFIFRHCYLFFLQEDVSRKPLGQIPLESVSSVSRSEKLNTFEVREFYSFKVSKIIEFSVSVKL